jgi:hypothetical protein
VEAAHPAYGPSHGYDGFVPARPGPHRVCAYALNVAGFGDHQLLGCRDVFVPGWPVGSVDVARARPGAVGVGGWALDPDTPAAIDVHVYVGGGHAGTVRADAVRADVGAHGFNVVVPAPAGRWPVCAYGIESAGTGGNTLIGCREVTVGGAAIGALDVAQGGGGSVRVAGWAIDPDVAGPIPVHVYVDGRYAGVATAGRSRPDVAAAHPGYGDAHGFDVTVADGGAGRQVCVYGIDQAGGQPNALIRCAPV